MKLKDKKILIICGPTATGKTKLALNLASKFAGELVCADSHQVYRGMDIGTGKDLPLNSKLKSKSIKLPFNNQKYKIGYYLVNKIPVWLYDVVQPDYRFTVADYVACAHLVIKNIWEQGKLPILVGGTGFYIQALINGIETLGIPPNWDLRQELNGWSTNKLLLYLEKLDSSKAALLNCSDRFNPRRLIRAIEVALADKTKKKTPFPKIEINNILMIGLRAHYNFLYRQVDKRVVKRVKQGIEAEINKLLKRGYNWQNSALGETLGYREWELFFKDLATKEEVIERWQFNEHAYVRQQLTWFRKEKRIHWFDISQDDWGGKIVKTINNWFKNKDKKLEK